MLKELFDLQKQNNYPYKPSQKQLFSFQYYYLLTPINNYNYHNNHDTIMKSDIIIQYYIIISLYFIEFTFY